MASTGAAWPIGECLYQSGQEYRNTEQNQQERSSDIPPYQWNSSYQGDFSGNREPSGQQAPRDSYGQQYPLRNRTAEFWNQMIMAVHFPIGTGSIGKMEQDFSLPPSGWPPQEPKQKMSVGVKGIYCDIGCFGSQLYWRFCWIWYLCGGSAARWHII